MKKVLIALVVFLGFSLPTKAIITPEEAASQQYINSHGYSNEMSRLIDLQDAHINATRNKYVSNEPALYSDKKINFIRKVFMYFDCGLDDGKFMQNNIDYTTRWDDL